MDCVILLSRFDILVELDEGSLSLLAAQGCGVNGVKL